MERRQTGWLNIGQLVFTLAWLCVSRGIMHIWPSDLEVFKDWFLSFIRNWIANFSHQSVIWSTNSVDEWWLHLWTTKLRNRLSASLEILFSHPTTMLVTTDTEMSNVWHRHFIVRVKMKQYVVETVVSDVYEWHCVSCCPNYSSAILFTQTIIFLNKGRKFVAIPITFKHLFVTC